MKSEETLSSKLEQGRAKFAYRCAEEGKQIHNYKSYVRKIPTMILTNGLGQTLAFILSKSQKGEAGTENNPKNAYDLIYRQLTEYMRSDSTIRINMPSSESDLAKWVISCDSTNYRYITQEFLAFLNWLSRFAEGMIEGEQI